MVGSMTFTIKSSYQKEDMVEFQRVIGLTVQRVRALLPRIMFFFLGALFFITGCSMAVKGSGNVWAFGGIIAGVVLCIPGLFHHKFLAGSAWRRWKRRSGDKAITFTFDSEGVLEEMEGNSYRTRYSEVYACVENRAYFFLFFSKREGYILKKSDFLEGRPEKFPAALENWCNGHIKVYPVSDPR